METKPSQPWHATEPTKRQRLASLLTQFEAASIEMYRANGVYERLSLEIQNLMEEK
jgi:hypothetical protein